MALAAISGILSTTILGGIIPCNRSIRPTTHVEKKKAGGACGMQLWLQRLRAHSIPDD